MKTSMKLMVMTLVVAMLLSMSAFAASVSYGSIAEPVLNGDDYSVTLNYTADGYAAGDQVTLLVLIDSAEIIFAEGSNNTVPTNVIYIDQQTISAAAGSFTFTVAKATVENKEVYVKLGATAQAAAATGTSTVFVKTQGGEEIEVDVNNSSDDAFGLTGTTLISISPKTPIAEGKVMTVNGAEMFYTLYNGVKKYIALVANFDLNTAVFSTKDGTPAKVVFGDVNGGDEQITGSDVSDLTAIAVGKTELTTDYAKLVADVTGNGSADGGDVSEATAIAVGKQQYPTAAGVE